MIRRGSTGRKVSSKLARFSLDKKQLWEVMMKINKGSHKMSIKKLYKITKTTPLSNPVAKKMGIA